MKPGDMVSTKSRIFIGVIIESRVMVTARGMTAEQARLRGENVNSHHVYWSSPKVKKNPVWVKERDLVKAV
jgi:hypothetical protein